jgi:hypothetical protein
VVLTVSANGSDDGACDGGKGEHLLDVEHVCGSVEFCLECARAGLRRCLE